MRLEMTDPIDRAVRDPECLLISGLSRSTRDREEKAGRFPKRFKIRPDGQAVAWWESELRERNERIKREATAVEDTRPRDKGRFAAVAAE